MISKSDFSGFIRILFPQIKDNEVKSMWYQICSSAGLNDAEKVDKHVLLDWIGDKSDIVKVIIGLPHCNGFETIFYQMDQKTEIMFNYIKTRYITFIPKIVPRLNNHICEQIVPSIFKLRNSLLRCDLSGSFTFYRYILQTVDLMITQENPFIIFTSSITNEEMDRLVEFMKYREKVAATSIGIELS
jgi:hypothetical protein